MKRKHGGISVWIDKLTDSIVEVKTGKRFDTEMSPLTKNDLKQITKKTFVFPWKKMFKEHVDWEFFKLTIKGDERIQGLLAYGMIDENTPFVYDVESAKFNVPKFNKGVKLYEGVGGNLFAFACKTSLERGYFGFVGFESKLAVFTPGPSAASANS